MNSAIFNMLCCALVYFPNGSCQSSHYEVASVGALHFIRAHSKANYSILRERFVVISRMLVHGEFCSQYVQ